MVRRKYILSVFLKVFQNDICQFWHSIVPPFINISAQGTDNSIIKEMITDENIWSGFWD
nr:MAG TPA: hypothetical protein [Caudoviricetes sp.]